MRIYMLSRSSNLPVLIIVLATIALTVVSRTIAAPGEALGQAKISDTEGAFTGTLDNGDSFGSSVTAVGDLDGDGVGDLAVGAYDDDGGVDFGAVWILFLNANGTTKAHQKISNTVGSFTGILEIQDFFGSAVAAIGDLDGDSVGDLAVGAYGDDDGGSFRGAVWILFLNTNGTVKSHQKISDTEGGFTGTLDNFDQFGYSVASLGDLDRDGINDIAVGANQDADGGPLRGAVWVLFLNANGTVKAYQKISDTAGGFIGVLDNADWFGSSVAGLKDLNNDGELDLAVGAVNDDDGGTSRGAVWVLFLNTNGTVHSHQKISDTQGGFTGILDDADLFGSSLAMLPDLNNDGVDELAVGAESDDDGGDGRGAVWTLFLNTDGTVGSLQKISDTEGGFGGSLDDEDKFGSSITSLGDLDGDGAADLAVGAPYDDDGGPDRGAIWMLFLDDVAFGDYDGDGDLDLNDYVILADCIEGPDVTPAPTPPTTSDDCLDAFDFEPDGDVDLADFASFQSVFTGQIP